MNGNRHRIQLDVVVLDVRALLVRHVDLFRTYNQQPMEPIMESLPLLC